MAYSERLLGMQSNSAKTFGLLCLSALLAYSSVAWAFDECLWGDDGNGIERVNEETFDDLGPIGFTGGGDNTDGLIHCVSTYRSFDVAAPAFSARSVTQSFKDLPSALLPSNNFAAWGELNFLTGRSPPGWASQSFSSGQQSRYLILSVFLV